MTIKHKKYNLFWNADCKTTYSLEQSSTTHISSFSAGARMDNAELTTLEQIKITRVIGQLNDFNFETLQYSYFSENIRSRNERI